LKILAASTPVGTLWNLRRNDAKRTCAEHNA